MGDIKVGTASWTDKSLIESGTFYPEDVKTAEARLRFYAEHFDTVEVDSSYYGMPSERNSRLWVERTPAEFTFHIKAYSILTGHPTRVRSIPEILRRELPKAVREKSKPKDFPKEIVEAAFDMFAAALNPLQAAGKLGCILLQFPPWFVPSQRAYTRLELAREKLARHRPAVEFRNRRWITSPERENAFAFLREHGFPYVIVDAPWLDVGGSPAAVTAAEAYVRLHGRNRENWFTKGIDTVERYRYLYSEDEIRAWAKKVKDVGKRAEKTFVLFNNCYQNYGVKNAGMLKTALKSA